MSLASHIQIIKPVPVLRIVYNTDMVKPASQLRDVIRKLTNNNREKLLILMGKDNAIKPDLTVYFIETESTIKVETSFNVEHRGHIKVFAPDKLMSEQADAIGAYVLHDCLKIRD